jgi:glycosyltransferase involved in cell wall biosynthesis
MKVLIIHPEFRDPGGVAAFYLTLSGRLTVEVKHLSIGKRVRERPLSTFFRLVTDFIRFVRELKDPSYDVVCLNPSLGFKAVVREGFYIFVAKRCFRKKVVVVIHGWEKGFERILERAALPVFRTVYDAADAFVVLAEDFRNTLRKWRFRQPVYLETTVVDDDLIEGFDIQKALNVRQRGSRKLLFMSRIIREKGIYETIDAFALLRSKRPEIELVVAGDGEELGKVKEYVKEHKIQDVVFTGYARGDLKRRLFETASVFLFPTHGEGMPICVLEAMAFGLPVVTRPVGGMADFFKNGEHGFVTECKEASAFADLTESLLSNSVIYEQISLRNHEYAIGRFLASKVADRFTKIYTEVMDPRV